MAGGFVDLVVPGRHSRRLMLAGLQRMSVAALLMLVAQYALGIVLNLYVAVPSADAHAGILRLIVNGPLTLTLHVLLGLVLVGTAIVLLVRAVTVGDRRFAVLAAGGLTAIGGAFAAGEIFVRGGAQFADATMAILTAVALLCYIGTLTLASSAYRQVARHRRHTMNMAEPDADDPDPWPPDYDEDPDADDTDPWPPDYDEDSDPPWRARPDEASRPSWLRGLDEKSGLLTRQSRDDTSRPPRRPDRRNDSGQPWRQGRDDSGPAWSPDFGQPWQGRDGTSGQPWRQGRDGTSGPAWPQSHEDNSGLAWLPDRGDSGPRGRPEHDLDDAELGLVWTPDADISVPAPRPSWPDSGRSWSAPPGAR